MLTIAGPKQQNVEQLTEYKLTVANPGTAEAKEVLVTADLPPQMKFESASDEGRFLENRVAWVLKTLPPGEARSLTLQVRAKAQGEMCIDVEALATDAISGKELPKVRDRICTDFRGGETGLHIEMVDRSDPIEVGGTITYPIRVLSQGQLPASNIRIRAILPQGMTFLRAAGPTKFRQQGPAVEFEPLPTLPAGQNVVYEIFAQAVRDGDWRFRVEMTADQLPAGPVIEQESTTVFREDNPPPPPPPPPPGLEF
jgi:uncharacterized repeat protein (TIGR01451 family)